MKLTDTKTLENLKAALAGESIARNKYTYFAQAARRDGYEKLAEELEAMAVNEMTHARLWFELVHGKPGDALTNLENAMRGELEEWKNMYPKFAKTAREEGLEEVAVMFESVAAIEKSHEERFMKLFIEIKNMQAGKEEENITPEHPQSGYRCMFCGAIFEERPDVCPVCQAIGSFDLVGKN